MHKWFENGKYMPLSLEEAVQWTTQILPLFEEANVDVIRVGLHPSEGLLTGHELIAGPFHQSFKELVLTEIWKQQLQPLTENKNQKNLKVYVPPKELNYAIGYSATNKKMLLEQFDTVEFVSKSELRGRSFEFLLS